MRTASAQACATLPKCSTLFFSYLMMCSHKCVSLQLTILQTSEPFQCTLRTCTADCLLCVGHISTAQGLLSCRHSCRRCKVLAEEVRALAAATRAGAWSTSLSDIQWSSSVYTSPSAQALTFMMTFPGKWRRAAAATRRLSSSVMAQNSPVVLAQGMTWVNLVQPESSQILGTARVVDSSKQSRKAVLLHTR